MSEVQAIRPIGWTGPTGARVVRHWRGSILLDNYNPPRKTGGVEIEEWEWPPSDDGFVGLEFVIIGGMDVLPTVTHARVLLDDGETLRLMYVCGYHPKHRYVGLKSITPAGVGGGEGPATLYHVMIKAVSE